MKKGLKKLLATVGLTAIVVPASFSVAGCDFNRFLEGVQGPNGGFRPGGDNNIPDLPNIPGQNNNKLVVDAINKIPFRLGIRLGDDVNSFKSGICANFIKSWLPENIQRIYNPSLYIRHDILNEYGVSLSSADVQTERLISAKILYDYGEIKNQTANFTIPVIRVR